MKPKSARGGAAVVALGGWTGGDGLAALLQGHPEAQDFERVSSQIHRYDFDAALLALRGLAAAWSIPLQDGPA